MTDEERRRLDVLERSIAQLHRRLDRLEQGQTPSAASTAEEVLIQKPPIIARPGPAARQHVSQEKPEPTKLNPVSAAPKKINVDEIEYRIGTMGLLKGGAVVVVLALLFLVAMAISRGYITMPVQFAGEIILCLAFIAFGILKRKLPEDFGDIMVGIGTCGLYLSFAGAHVYKGILSSEAVVGLFTGLSLVAIGYAHYKASKAFLTIGLIGGLISSVLPVDKGHIPLSVALHLLILVPCLAISVRRKWQEMVIAAGFVSAAILVPTYLAQGDWIWRLAVIQTSATLSALAYILVIRDSPQGNKLDLIPFALITGGFAGVSLDVFTHKLWTSLPMAAVLCLLAIPISRMGTVLRDRVLVSAATIALVFAPMAVPAIHAAYIYIGLSVAIGITVLVRPALSYLIALGWIDFVFAVIAFFILGSGDFLNFEAPTEVVRQAEFPFLLAVIVAGITMSYASFRRTENRETALLVATLTAAPFYLQATSLLFESARRDVQDLKIFLPLMALAVGNFIAARTNRWATCLGIGWMAAFGQAMWWFGCIQDSTLSQPMELTMLTGLIAVFVFGTWITTRSEQIREHEMMVGLASVAVGVFATRGLYLLLVLPSGPFAEMTACFAALTLVAWIAAGISAIRHWIGVTTVGVGAAVLASMILVEPFGSEGLRVTYGVAHYGPAIATVLVLTAVLTRAHPQTFRTSGPIAMTWIWALLTGLSQSVPIAGLQPNAAMTAVWIGYAVILIICGFAFRAQAIRFGSLAVFGATLLKVFMVDLANLDAAIRVGILMALGIGMVGAGYWYVRLRGPAAPKPEIEEEPTQAQT